MLGGQFQGFVVKDLDYSGRSWGSIRSESYCQYIVPVLAQYVDRTRLILIQDNAKGHAAKATL